MPSRSICGLGWGMTLTPSQSLMSAAFCSFFSSGATITGFSPATAVSAISAHFA